jgi:hypothetical protein
MATPPNQISPYRHVFRQVKRIPGSPSTWPVQCRLAEANDNVVLVGYIS